MYTLLPTNPQKLASPSGSQIPTCIARLTDESAKDLLHVCQETSNSRPDLVPHPRRETLSVYSLCNSISHLPLPAFFPSVRVTDISSSKTKTDRKWLLSSSPEWDLSFLLYHKPFLVENFHRFLSVPSYWCWLSPLRLQLIGCLWGHVTTPLTQTILGFVLEKPFSFSSWKFGRF